MNNPRVSVLITFYNQEDYVDKAIKSVISQKTDFGIKILIGDDGSSDGTIEKVNAWIEKYPDVIELFVMERGEGKQVPGFRASKNRLNLIKHVDTEYFAFLDGDDYFCNDLKLQNQVDVLDNENNKDCVACAHNLTMLYPDGREKLITDEKLREGKYSQKKYWRNMYFHTDTIVARKTAISAVPERLVENNYNDNAITFLLLQCGDIYYIPESWAVYVQTDEGIWAGSKLIINCIRSMLLYDLCNQINPKMKPETAYRFLYVWEELYKHRKEIDKSELVLYEKEAFNKNFSMTYRWINYNEKGVFLKAWLRIRMRLIRIMLILECKFKADR